MEAGLAVARSGTKLVLLCALMTSCYTGGRSTDYADEFEFVASGTRREVLEGQLREFASVFVSRVQETADRIRASTSDSIVRRNALSWKTGAISAAQAAAFRIEPIAALLDLWALSMQMRLLFTEGVGDELFGADQDLAIVTTRNLEAIVTEIAMNSLADPEDVKTTIEEWARAHPLESLSFARDSVIFQFADQATQDIDVFEAVVSLESMTANLTQQVRTWASMAPAQARWQAELLRDETFDSDVLLQASADFTRLTDSLQRIAVIAESLSEFTSTEVQTVVESITNQRVAIVEALSRERQAVIATLQAERAAVMESIRAERIAVIDALSGERTRTVEEITGLVSRTVEDSETRVNRVVDHLMWRVTQLAAAGAILLIPLLWICSRLIRVGRS